MPRRLRLTRLGKDSDRRILAFQNFVGLFESHPFVQDRRVDTAEVNCHLQVKGNLNSMLIPRALPLTLPTSPSDCVKRFLRLHRDLVFDVVVKLADR